AGVARGLLRVAGPAAGPARAGGRTTGPRDRGDPRGEPAAVWQPADSRRTGGPRLPDESEARGALDAGPRARRPAPPAVPGDDPLATRVPRRAQRPGAAVRAGRGGVGVGRRRAERARTGRSARNYARQAGPRFGGMRSTAGSGRQVRPDTRVRTRR